MVTAEDVSRHVSRRSCWVVIRGQAYDVTDFMNEHPGGPSSIFRNAGKDATEEFEEIHPDGTLEKHLDKKYHLGAVDGDINSIHQSAVSISKRAQIELPPLSTLLNVDEFERLAEKVASEKAWMYYSSAADTLASLNTNRNDWSKVSFRPRVLRDVAKVDTTQNIMGYDASLPIFAAPAAQARLGNPEGELCIVRGAAHNNIPYVTSNAASVGHGDMSACLRQERNSNGAYGGALMWQLYVPIKKLNAKSLIAEARRLGFKALVVTVDAAVIGKREKDEQVKARLDAELGITLPRSADPKNANLVPRGTHSSTLNWSDLKWIREEWGQSGPFIIKGIQTAEDALMAAQSGVDGIYLSNHGGRQLDFAPSSIRTLLEIRKFCPQVLEKVDVYLDGGCRRGSDVVKALCLGAKAVGFGRPFLYALSAYGTEGVDRMIQSK